MTPEDNKSIEIQPNPDDNLIEPCVVCKKLVLVFVSSIIVTDQGRRWTYCGLECLLKVENP